MNTPYEYYNNKLGVKISYLIFDKSVNQNSLKVISYNALNKRIKSTTCSEKQLRRASLNYEALVEFNSLQQEWRDRLTTKFGSPKAEIKKSYFEQHYETDKKAFDFYAAYRFEDNKKLEPLYIDLYTYNASVIQTVLRIKNDRKAYMKSQNAKNINIWESLTNDVNAFREVSHKLPNTSRGLRIQVNKFLQDGYVGLISGKFQNSNASKVKEDVQQAVIDELLAKGQNFDNVQVANFYNAVAKPMGWKEITPATIANIKEERNLIVYAGRKGSQALSNNVLMQNKRQNVTKPMLYWTMDGWDAELLYQKTTTDKRGYSITTYNNRLSVVVVLDPFNKYPVGYAIGTHETPELIKAALRNAIQHTKQLFGAFYKPYQLQTDHYGRGSLAPLYEACTMHYTPAKVKNAKSKVIEPWFNRFNKEYCQIFENWSGHNVNSGSTNQPNDEMLNKLRHTFPDEKGCMQQLIVAIEADRAKKVNDYLAKWSEVSEEYRNEMTFEMYLRTLGDSTGYTNRLQHDGLNITINGLRFSYDSFDMKFRQLSHLDWLIKYDPSDLSKVIAVNAESKNSKLVKEIASYEFVLEQKYMPSMALAERNPEDGAHLAKVKAHNNDVMAYISDVRHDNYEKVTELFKRPELNDTLAKLLLVDSRGQHKNQKSNNRLKEASRELIEVQEVAETTQQQTNWNNSQHNYNSSKINLNDYL